MIRLPISAAVRAIEKHGDFSLRLGKNGEGYAAMLKVPDYPEAAAVSFHSVGDALHKARVLLASSEKVKEEICQADENECLCCHDGGCQDHQNIFDDTMTESEFDKAVEELELEGGDFNFEDGQDHLPRITFSF